MSSSAAAGSFDKRKVNAWEGLVLCHMGCRDSGNRVSKSIYSPLIIFCFTFSGSGTVTGTCAGLPVGALS